MLDSVDEIDFERSFIKTKKNSHLNYSYLFNCAGPGALKLAENKNNLYRILLFCLFGQYGIMQGKLLENKYLSCSDPNLPF